MAGVSAALLSGANLAAIGDGTAENWEVFQFRTATLVAPGVYWLSGRLRGQAGSDALMPQVWPAGSRFVLLDGRPQQIDFSPNLRRVAQHFRIGPARRGYDDPSYRHLVKAFQGNGLRPLSPCHLSIVKRADSSFDLSWIRRTRLDGDAWEVPEVPLGEESERYLIRITAGGNILREQQVDAPGWTYSPADQNTDGLTLPFEVSVAQISAVYGPGLGQTRLVAG